MSVRLRFDFVDGDRPSPCLFTAPRETIEATRIEEVRHAIARAEQARVAGHWIAGFVSYEAAPAFDSALATRSPGRLPLVWFGVFDRPSTAPPVAPLSEPGPIRRAWQPDVTRQEYDRAVQRVRDAILEGDVYQANYTFRLLSAVPAENLVDQYAHLVAAARPPYAACLDLGRWQILSLSPELFFERRGGSITTRPMKGTMRRGRYAQEDETRRAALLASAKDRAENVMIVDLMRNDIARIAEVGSVDVLALFTVERYPTVFQMTSTVTGRLRPQTGLPEIFAALFPAGSVTGAPKASSMRLIAAIERAPRGVYCGAIGFAGPDGRAVFNVAIRTATLDLEGEPSRLRPPGYGGQAGSPGHVRPEGRTSVAMELGIGGGITWDSAADSEYDEALAKARAFDLIQPFSLVETMRLAHGSFVRRGLHLARLERSARFFDVALDRAGIDTALDRFASAHRPGAWRARLLVAPTGSVSIEAEPLVEQPMATRPAVRLAKTPVSSADVWLFHKTTIRGVHDRLRASWPDAWDVLLWNERGEITEFTIGNVVVEFEGRPLTPPVESGLLAGIYRETLLEAGVLSEAVVRREHLAEATRIWLINSVREWVEVRILTES